MVQDQLMIFIKNAVKGTVKTRIAATMGDEIALKIYRVLMDHTRKVTSKLSMDKALFYSDFIDFADQWDSDLYKKQVQEKGPLGHRMKSAFKQGFNNGYKKIVIIGSDCYEINTSIINEGFYQLGHYDVVLGPASDGGYYLLGMKCLIPELFEGKTFSTDKVLEEAIDSIVTLNKSFFLLPTLNDIDNEEDARKSGIISLLS